MCRPRFLERHAENILIAFFTKLPTTLYAMCKPRHICPSACNRLQSPILISTELGTIRLFNVTYYRETLIMIHFKDAKEPVCGCSEYANRFWWSVTYGRPALLECLISSTSIHFTGNITEGVTKLFVLSMIRQILMKLYIRHFWSVWSARTVLCEFNSLWFV